MLSRTRIFVLLSLMGFYSSALAANSNFTNIQQLLNQGKADIAYERLVSMQAKHEGELEYDLLLAQAALLSKRANIALFVLERVLIFQPRHYQARLLIANAYARLGRPGLARNELSMIMAAKSAHPQLKQQAETLLAQVNAAQTTNHIRGYVEMGFGIDQNANSSTESLTFLGFNLSPESIATPSMSQSLKLGMSWQKKLKSKSALFTTLDWSSNLFPQAVFVNNEVINYQFGWQKSNRYSLSARGTRVSLTGKAGREGSHNDQYISGQWKLGKSRKSSLYLRIGEQHFLPAEEIRDVTQYQFGGQLSLAKWMKNTQLSTVLAQDVAVLPDSPYGREQIGVNLRTKLQFMNPVTVSMGVGVLYSDYRGLFFGLGRQERQFSLDVGLHTKRWTNWELGLDMSYTDTWSSIELYDYDRFTLGLKFKRNY